MCLLWIFVRRELCPGDLPGLQIFFFLKSTERFWRIIEIITIIPRVLAYNIYSVFIRQVGLELNPDFSGPDTKLSV